MIMKNTEPLHYRPSNTEKFKQTVWIVAVCTLPVLAAAQTPASKLRETIGLDTIGMNLAYVEQQLGPAMRSDGNEHSFMVNGCAFTLTTDQQGRSIHMVEIRTSKACPFTMGQFLSKEDSTPIHGLTFQGVESIAGKWHYKASCIYLCGNGVPSHVYYWLPGDNANRNIEVAFGRDLDDEEVQPALQKMNDRLVAQLSEEFVQFGQFNCLPNKGNEVMAEAMRSVQIDRVVFGRERIDLQLGIDCVEG
ncbi:hypothetical protein E9531_17260 [Lampropedia puyangensis]|uniref:Uncharacterized protein n=1 Tax=Lampropedia puyangensis TaxID=1330072 RepID=A0A4S8ESS3_9BURK|nr:hypothetical protein [Lampropedia puyangensis]THT95311.1 hypothetical protein E9531_17260 [Lampropedia puyangensis]